MIDLASPSSGLILRVGLLLGAAVAINYCDGGDVEVENPCFFSTGGPDNSPSQKINAVGWRTNRRRLATTHKRTSECQRR